ncbi:UNVERIFIED_CONTAM: hypothetical protein GTU68_021633, partial [Idotea baltica]|nr:hypothetical protein [Idotea baltica]
CPVDDRRTAFLPGWGFSLFQVRQELSPWVSRLWEEKPQKYSRALLETLSIIAYRQPMTRGEIEEIRGVSVSSSITKTLLEREWVRIVGHRDVPGKPALYATTKQFLDYFNLKRLDELPTLNDIRDIAELEPELGFAEPDQASLDESEHEDQTAEPTEGSAAGQESPQDNGLEEDGASVSSEVPVIEEETAMEEIEQAPPVSTLQ